MKRHAPTRSGSTPGEPQLITMSPLASSSQLDESSEPSAGPLGPSQTQPQPPPAPHDDGEGQEKKRKATPSGGRSLRFMVPGDPQPQPRQPRGWLDQLSYADEAASASSERFPYQSRQEDIDQLLQAGPRFSDLIRPGWSDVPERQPEVAEEHYRQIGEAPEAAPPPASVAASGAAGSGGGVSATAMLDPDPVIASPVISGKGVGRFDEAEIENRRRIHYRAHQPLKSLEPKVLRKLKDRIEQGRTQAVMAREAGVQKPLPVEGAAQDADDEDSRGKRSGRRRRRRRRRHRSKKSEPFQPTLGHVSEEQQSMTPDDDDDDDDASSFDPDGGQDTLDEMEEDMDEDEQQKERGAAVFASSAGEAPSAALATEGPAGVTLDFTDADAPAAELPGHGAGGESGLEAVNIVPSTERNCSSSGGGGGKEERRRPSFHLGWDSTRNSEANLPNMNQHNNQMPPHPHHPHLERSQTTSDACGPDTCCSEDPATCPEPPCASETCPENLGDELNRTEGRTKHKHHHHHHHGHREHFSKKDLRERCFSGAELRQLFLSQHSNSQAPTEAEEASGLKAKDLDEMSSHRLERHKVKHHRHKTSMHRANHSIVSVVEVDHVLPGMDGAAEKGLQMAGSPSTGAFRATHGVDHRPHDLFVELDELTFYAQDRMWQWNEKARWIRFEEDLVEGGERWGKAHVASLSFHSLLQMRNLLESATFIKDLEANDLEQIAGAIYDMLTHTHTLTDDEAEAVRRMLLLKHAHVGHGHDHRGRPSSPQMNHEMGERNFTTPSQLNAITEDGKHSKPYSADARRRSSLLPLGLWRLRRASATAAAGLSAANAVAEAPGAAPATRRRSLPFTPRSGVRIPSEPKIPESELSSAGAKSKRSLLDKIKPHIGGVADLLPTDCEVVSSLVGFSPFVSQTLTVVLRLAHGVLLPTFSEVDRPTRFIFLFLVPVAGTGCLDERDEYSPREIGRVFATLMADSEFHEIAYKAECREDLVSGLRDFLDNSVVLPPGEWDRATLLPVVKYQRERNAKQKRTQSMRTRQDTEPSMNSTHFGVSSGARLADMEAFLRYSSGVKSWTGRCDLLRVRAPPPYSDPSSRRSELTPSHSIFLDKESVPLMQPTEGGAQYPSSRHESLHSVDNDLAGALVGDGSLPDGGYPPDYTTTGTKGGPTCCQRFIRQCIPFAGLCNDLRRLKRRYATDWTDPFKKGGIADVIVSSFFLFFVALAPAITFGALMEEFVNKEMSLSKSLVAAGLFQFLFSLVGGQPQIVLGVTGPVFIIETTVGMMATTMNVDYVAFRFIVAVSASLWGLIFLTGNFASYLSRVPRSVEEIFNMFTAIFYLFKSIVSMARPILHGEYLKVIALTNATDVNATSAVTTTQAFQHFAASNGTMLIGLGTYTIVMTLAKFKQSRAFTRRVRWFLGSFNVPMAIFIMTLITNIVFVDYPLPSLDIPASAADPASWVTFPQLNRLGNASPGSILLAVLIGLCVHLLTFTETGICGLTLAKPETGMAKPTLFHLNILVVQTVMPLISGVLCWPFVTGAVVRSNAHVLALQVWEERSLPGVRRRLVGIREQRISGVAIGLLVFLSVFLGPYLLRLIPMGAMYGMFLFMGVSTFRGLQMVTRTLALLQRRRYWPEASYLQAPIRVLVTFTGIEWFIVLLLFALNCLTEFANLSYPSLFFPIILVVYGVLRIFVLPRWSLLKDHLSTIDKGHGVAVDPKGEPRRCCGRGARDEEDGSDFGASVNGSRRMTPVASVGEIEGGGGVMSAVYEKDSDDSDIDGDLYHNTDRSY